MNRKHIFSNGEYYHVYNRGTEKREIFLNYKDYQRFMSLLYLSNSVTPVNIENLSRKGRTFTEFFLEEKGERLVSIGAWCLMPNHFHILLKEESDNGIVKFMQKLSTGYSLYFNKKYNRTGSLFQGKFKSQHANEDRYLKYLFSYIHLNPVKLIPEETKWKEIGIQNIDKTKIFLDDYRYSSFVDYTKNEKRYCEPIISKESFPEYFLNTDEAIKEVEDWLSFVKVEPLQEIIGL